MVEHKERAYLGGGCFWCLDAVYRQIKGVNDVIAGYAGGNSDNPNYNDVGSGSTGHAEIVEIHFNPQVISYEEILNIFWTIHDPTTENRQGNDVGTQYRSIILYVDDKQKNVAEKSLNEVAKKAWKDPVITQIEELSKFYPAEDYHQDYFNKNPSQAYCQIVINPKLAKLQKQFASYLK